jgi:predicted transcriptional regulator
MDKNQPPIEVGARYSLGPLETQVLKAVWERGTATVRELLAEGKLWQTYPTIMTTMNRLFRKGLFDRTLEGRAFRYSARYSPMEVERAVALSDIRQLLRSEYASLHLSYLVEAVGEEDETLLNEMQSLIEKKRAEISKGEQR